jgi:hypothetical protein
MAFGESQKERGRRMRILRVVALGVSILILARVGVAQGVQYGSIDGTVVDPDGRPLPGVTVTAESPSLQGTRVAVVNEQGRFFISPLPIGQYQVTLSLEGFAPQTVTGVAVKVGTTTSLQVEMRKVKVQESIVVSAEQIVVDTTKSTTDTSIDWKLADTLPTQRQFTSLMVIAPMVQAPTASGYAPYVGGQSNSANLFLIDGVDTTDPKVGIWGTVINWDTIAEAQFQTAGFTAEYGRATGGILNLVTKSGGNQFHFTARLVRSDKKWSADNGIDSETDQKKVGGTTADEWRPSFTFGGPILKDQLWYYGSYEKRNEKTGTTRYATLDDLRAGTLTPVTYTNSGHYASIKLTWQVSQDHNLVAYYNEDPTEQYPLQAGIYGSIYSADTERRQEMGGENYSLRWTGVFSSKFFVEANYQNHSQHLNVIPTSSTFNSIPYTYDLYWGYASGGPSIDYRSDRDRDGVLFSGSYFLDTLRGSHQFKAGVEYSKIKNTLWNIWNSAGQYWNYLGGPYIRFLYLDQSGGLPTSQDYYAVYVEDQWRLGKLTLNLGVRSESTTIYNNRDNSVLKFGFGKQIAPRVGFAYDLNGDTVRGSLGRFYQMATNYIGDYFKVTTDHTQRWDWNYTCDPSTAAYYQFPDTCWSLIYDVPRYAGGTTLDPNLKPAYMDEFTAGYDRRITDQMAASVTFVWRWMNSQIDWYDPNATGYYVITNVPKKSDVGNLKWSDYQAVSLSLTKRFARDRLQFIADYTYSFKDDAWGVTWRDLGFFTFTNPELVDRRRYGRTFSPQYFKFNGSYILPWGAVVGLSAFWNSGNLYTATTAGTYGQVFIEKRGSSKVGNNWEADLYAEQPFKIGPVTMALYANVFNIFNNQQVVARQSNSGLATFRQPTAWQSPRAVQLGFKLQY